MPASAVSATDIAVSSCPGGETSTERASTGSVGAKAAASSIAPASPSPSHHTPRTATAAMVSGMAMARSCHVACQLRQVIAVSMASPAPASEMMTISSEACSITAVSIPPARGSITGRPSAAAAAPSAT